MSFQTEEGSSIPNKSYFKLDEVGEITGVKPYVLRFWESEFDEITPITSASGHKLYGHKDIESIGTIKNLLFDQKMTIERAKKSLYDIKNAVITEADVAAEEDNLIPAMADALTEKMATPSTLKKEVWNYSETDMMKMNEVKKLLAETLEFADSIEKRHSWT